MRDTKGMIPDLDNMVYDYIMFNNMVGDTVSDASIANAATDAYKAVVRAGHVDAAMDLKATAGCVYIFKHRFNLRTFLRCGEYAYADVDYVHHGREARSRIIAERKTYHVSNVWNCDETGLR